MKLRNKKTGEIVTADLIYTKADNCVTSTYSLAELNEDWEDYEEPRTGYWFIDYDGRIHKEDYAVEEEYKDMKEIGNYFETKEEAEKAVEKLKAWKRLKDKRFRFIEGSLDNNDDFIIKAELGYVGLIDRQDVHLLFGGEECES